MIASVRAACNLRPFNVFLDGLRRAISRVTGKTRTGGHYATIYATESKPKTREQLACR
jgi:hypothetical protein